MAVSAEEMTVEQRRALALARARVRMSESTAIPGAAESMRGATFERSNLGPAAQAGANFLHGATGMLRGTVGLVDDETSKILDIPGSNPDSAGSVLGSLLDPMAVGTGAGMGRMVPYAKVLGKGAKEGAKALAKNLGSGAATGATVGGLTNDADREGGATRGAVIGAILNQSLPPAMQTVVKTGRFLKELFAPSAGKLAANAAGDKVDDVINALMTTRAATPGASLNAGQASVPSGSAEFAALQRLVDAKDPSRAVAAAGRQQGARSAAIQTVGGTPKALDSALAKRAADSEKAYNAAFQVPVAGDNELRLLAKNPFFESALPDAVNLAKANGVPLTNQNWPTPEGATQFLHYVKLSLDKQLGRTGDTALAATEKHAVTQLQKRLVKWLTGKNPAYEAARAGHEAASVPINQMELGQELERALVSPTGKERVAPFANAVRKAGQDTDVTGAPRIDVLAPQQRKVVDAIMGDVSREETWKRLAASGMDSLKDRIGAPELPPTGWFKPIVSAARSWFNRATGGMTEKGLKDLAVIMEKDPQVLAVMMRKFTPQQQAQVRTAIERFTLPATGGIVAATEQPE